MPGVISLLSQRDLTPRQLMKWDAQRPRDVTTMLVLLWCCYNTHCRDSGVAGKWKGDGFK